MPPGQLTAIKSGLVCGIGLVLLLLRRGWRFGAR
jgi:hypothetical protein